MRLNHSFYFIPSIFILTACFSDRNPVKPSSDFPTSVTGLSFASSAQTLDLTDGATVTLDAKPVKKTLHGVEVRMLGYNGSIPGPIIRVKQGTEITVRLKNHSGLPTSLHAHGVRMDYLMDGTSSSQQPIADGDSFTYHIKFPDPGLYWYHAHEREDYSQEMGLYGNILVVPADSAYWRPTNRDQILMLDDFYLDSATSTAPFKVNETNFTMMGRYGNLYLINGDTAFNMTVKRKEVVRFYATNSCNTRTLNIGLTDSGNIVRKIKVVGSDNGQYEYFDKDAETIIAPGERKIFEGYFDKAGTVSITHHMLKTVYNKDSLVVLGHITVLPDSVDTPFGATFLAEDSSLQTIKSIDSVRSLCSPLIPPTKFLLFTGKSGKMIGMKVSAAQGEPISTEAKGIEWVDNMLPMNAASTTQTAQWIIRDTVTKLENHEILWNFNRGEKVKIRIQNDPNAFHLMPHPIHFHGQRFLVVAVNGKPNLNMAWKDTYLVGMREVTDILLDASNPGGWMAHCHISEHAEDMMMFSFYVK